MSARGVLCLVLLAAPAARAAAPAGATLYERLASRVARDPELGRVGTRPPPEVDAMGWLLGEWDVLVTVSATPTMPERKNRGRATVERALRGAWLTVRSRFQGSEDLDQLTYDALTRRFVTVQTDSFGNHNLTTADGWRNDELSFDGEVVILGDRVRLRQRWIRKKSDAFQVVNEELISGAWVQVDEYSYTKRRAGR